MSSRTRPPFPDLARLSREQQVVAEDIITGPRGKLDPPLAVWLNRPALAQHAQTLGTYCRFGSSLPGRLSELAILLTAAWWKADFEWMVHAPIARGEGLREEIIESIRRSETPSFRAEEAQEQAVCMFASQLLAERQVRDVTYEATAAIIGTEQIVDLVGVLGYYSLISMTIIAFGIEARHGDTAGAVTTDLWLNS